MKSDQIYLLPIRTLSLLLLFQLSACAPAAGPAGVQSPNPVSQVSNSGQAQPDNAQNPVQGTASSGQNPSSSTPAQAEPPPVSQPPLQEPQPVSEPVAEPVAETKIENINGIWVSSDGTRYYMRHGYDRIFIFAEHVSDSAPWSMAGMAVLDQKTSIEKVLTVMYSIPRGKAPSSQNIYGMTLVGSKLDLKLAKGSGGDLSLSLEKAMTLPQIYEIIPMATAPSKPPFKLTGAWKGNDGGTYYLRQEGNVLIWYGENDSKHPGWANLAFGSISGKTVVMHWADMPKAAAVGSGAIKLNISDDNTLERIETEGGGFGGSKWERIIPEAAI